MYKLICQKTAHFLSALMAMLSSFFQVFVVRGMYNFDKNPTRQARVFHSIENSVFLCFFILSPF